MQRRPSSILSLILIFWILAAPAPRAQQRPAASSPQPTEPPPAAQQTVGTAQASPTPPEDNEDDVVRITTNLVQLDVVVTDKEGRQVTDLRPEEFELYEDGKQQPITSFSYVNLQPAMMAEAPLKTKPDKTAPPVPPVRLRPEQVRRTVALVVDDLGLSFESMSFVRHALKKFVDEQMQPGDLVAIIRTSAGMGAMQQFTTDKQMLHSVIGRIRWYPMGRSGISAFAPIEFSMETDEQKEMRRSRGAAGEVTIQERERRLSQRSGASGSMSDPAGGGSPNADPAAALESFREQVFSVGTLGALNYIVKGLGELPGRKSIILFSDGFSLRSRENPRSNLNSQLIEGLRRISDLATRASVVIYAIEAAGLQFPGLMAGDNTWGMTSEQVDEVLAGRRDTLAERQSSLSYLARQTGGFAVINSNDLPGGIRRVLKDQQGFYLIGYRPDSTTFSPEKGRGIFHRVVAKVKRPGMRVRSRQGFYGFTEGETRAAVITTRHQQLAAALTSPFASGNLRLRLTPLFGSTEASKPFITLLLHINAEDLTVVEEPDGLRKAVLDLVALTFGEQGAVLDELNRTETIRMKPVGYDFVKRRGLVYVIQVPVKKPGAYQLRVAVRDATAKRVGSANQFIQVPDLRKNRLTLSGIMMITPRASAQVTAPAGGARQTPAGMQQTPAVSAQAPADASTQTSAQSAARPPAANPANANQLNNESLSMTDAALRRFRRGNYVDYYYQIYNARLDRQTQRPQLQTQFRLFREGREVATGALRPLNVDNQTDMQHLQAGTRMLLGTGLTPGEYVLQVVVTDLLAPEKRRIATQWIDFEIIE